LETGTAADPDAYASASAAVSDADDTADPFV
jgi:hypothetical protein